MLVFISQHYNVHFTLLYSIILGFKRSLFHVHPHKCILYYNNNNCIPVTDDKAGTSLLLIPEDRDTNFMPPSTLQGCQLINYEMYPVTDLKQTRSIKNITLKVAKKFVGVVVYWEE